MKIEIVHAECWNGGAERLLFSLAAALIDQGHEVRITTTWIDEYWRGQPVSKNIPIRLLPCSLFHGDWYCRNLFIAVKDMLSRPFLSWFKRDTCPYDMVISDFSPSAIPLYHYLYGEKVKQVYYCHFPHQLMVPPSRNFLYGLYVFLMGLIEEHCLTFVDVILNNSFFTTEKMQCCMPILPRHKMSVLYPAGESRCISSVDINEEITRQTMLELSHRFKVDGRPIIFTLNRYWPEKNLHLLIEAAGLYAKRRKRLMEGSPKILVVFAGSIIYRFPESPAYYTWLKSLAKDLDLEKDVIFMVSPSEIEKEALFRLSHTVVYTPTEEHFGIVPVEALYQGKLCIACDGGGPSETIVDGVTGYRMKHSDPASFAECLEALLTDKRPAGKFARISKEKKSDLWRSHLDKFEMKTFADNLRKMTQL